ncbi:MAG: pyridoxal phosphate-dependent aminotransferase [Pseudomonadota bacterium]
MRGSKRLNTLVPGGDDGWGLYLRATSMHASGQPVVMLTIGDHDIHTDPAIVAAMAESAAAGHLGYAPVPGTEALRQAIATRVTAQTATRATPAEITVTPGGQAGLFAALMAATDPGEGCVLLDPCYATYPQTVRAAGARPVVVPAPAEGGFQPDVPAIAAALDPGTRAILINTPNNPTGAVYTRPTLEALARLCIERDLWLISDEVYDTQVWQGAHLSPRALPGMAERTLVVNSLSKSHAMTGSRVGWVVAPEVVTRELWHLSTATTYGLPGFIQDGAAFALTEGLAAEQAIVTRYRRRREAALVALGTGPGFRVVPPQGGMYIMLDVRQSGLTGEEFATRLLEEHLIAVMPGESFGSAAAGHLRIALTQPEEVLVPALRTIASLAGRLAAQRAVA